tara:strand:+ start:1034 stop:1267 length:234 start_codon:yes stop_codon:yes gene_type:complete
MYKHSYLKDILAIDKENAPAVFPVTKNLTSRIFSDCRTGVLGIFLLEMMLECQPIKKLTLFVDLQLCVIGNTNKLHQ